jgi:predicted metal-dependent hydrolase
LKSVSLPSEYFTFWELWERGEFYEAHEVLEDAWRRETNPERKLFFQGLIHCAVALVHGERRNSFGAQMQLAKAKDKLARCGREYSRLEAATLLSHVQQKLKELL